MDLQDPNEHVANMVLLRLDYRSIQAMKFVSKHWLNFLSGNRAFWREKFELDFGEWEGGDVDFEKEYKIEYGFRFREPRVLELEGDRGHVTQAKLDGAALAVFDSFHKYLEVWDLDAMEHHTFKADEESDVRSIAICGEKVFVGLDNGEIQVWCKDLGGLLHSWKAHNGVIWALSLANGLLASGSGTDNLKLWDASTFECLREFESMGQRHLRINGNEVLCGFSDSSLVEAFQQEEGLLYTINTGRCVTSVHQNSTYIFVSCGYGYVTVWDKKTKEQVATLRPDCPLMKCVWCDERTFITASSRICIRYWDAKSLTCIRSIKADPTDVRRLRASKGKVAMVLSTGNIRVLDFVN